MVTRTIARLLLITAIAGWALSALVHLATFGGVDAFENSGWTALLPAALFPLFFVTVRTAVWCMPGGRDGFEAAAKDTPVWIGHLVILTAAYAFLVVFLTTLYLLFLTGGGRPHEMDGRLVVTSGRVVVRELTPAQFHRYQVGLTRGFSAVWLGFYGLVTLMLWSEVRRRARPPQG